MSSIFTKIIEGQIPCYKIAENDSFFAFLDIDPNAAGHTLVVPKKEVNKIFDLDRPTYLGLMDFSYEIAGAIELASPCKRGLMMVIGVEVPHVHVHLIPLNQMIDATFGKKVKLSKEEFETIAKKISEHLL